MSRPKHKRHRLTRTASTVSADSSWVRYMSPEHRGYRVLLSPRQLQAFGPPRDPWGKKMTPAKGTAPRVIDPQARRQARQAEARH